MGTRSRSTLVVEAEHYGIGEMLWMFDMTVIRKVVVQQVQVDVGADGKGVAKHLVESVEAFDLKDGSLVPAAPRTGLWPGRVMWQWPETKQLHETREDALADMKDRIRTLRGEGPAE